MAGASSSAPPRLFALRDWAPGRRLDRALADGLGVSRAEARRLLARGGVWLDERPLGAGDKGMLLPRDGELRVEGFVPPAERFPPPPPPHELAPAVLASGPGWLAVDKPAGMPVHPLHPDERGSALAHLMWGRVVMRGVGEGGLRSGVVHRLDVDTSGALLFATREPSWRRLRAAFAEHRVAKTYRALAHGRFKTPTARGGGRIEQEFALRVARHRPARVRVVEAQQATAAGVRFVRQSVRLLEQFDGVCLLEVCPQTGFLHQIRATLAHIGHPLLGDDVYADRLGETAGVLSKRLGVERQMLHAAHLRFEEIEAEAPDAPDFAHCLAALRGTVSALRGRP